MVVSWLNKCIGLVFSLEDALIDNNSNNNVNQIVPRLCKRSTQVELHYNVSNEGSDKGFWEQGSMALKGQGPSEHE